MDDASDQARALDAVHESRIAQVRGGWGRRDMMLGCRVGNGGGGRAAVYSPWLQAAEAAVALAAHTEGGAPWSTLVHVLAGLPRAGARGGRHGGGPGSLAAAAPRRPTGVPCARPPVRAALGVGCGGRSPRYDTAGGANPRGEERPARRGRLGRGVPAPSRSGGALEWARRRQALGSAGRPAFVPRPGRRCGPGSGAAPAGAGAGAAGLAGPGWVEPATAGADRLGGCQTRHGAHGPRPRGADARGPVFGLAPRLGRRARRARGTADLCWGVGADARRLDGAGRVQAALPAELPRCAASDGVECAWARETALHAALACQAGCGVQRRALTWAGKGGGSGRRARRLAWATPVDPPRPVSPPRLPPQN